MTYEEFIDTTNSIASKKATTPQEKQELTWKMMDAGIAYFNSNIAGSFRYADGTKGMIYEI